MKTDSLFNQYCSQIAGTYNGVVSKVINKYSDSTEVAMHESIHERICTLLPDGRLLFVASWIKKISAFGVDQSKISNVCKALQEESEFAHEVFATYLAIKMMDSAFHQNAYDANPVDYQEYYNTLAVKIDTHINSSYLQYIIAWGVCSVVFSSTAISATRPRDIVNLKSTNQTILDSPTSRLKFLLSKEEVWGENLVDLVNRCITQYIDSTQYEMWDVLDDEGWKSTDPDIRLGFERYLFGEIKTFLVDRTEISCCTEDDMVKWFQDAMLYLRDLSPDAPIACSSREELNGLLNEPEDLLSWYQSGSVISMAGGPEPHILYPMRMPSNLELGPAVAIRRHWHRMPSDWLFFEILESGSLRKPMVADLKHFLEVINWKTEDGYSLGFSGKLLLLDSFSDHKMLADFIERKSIELQGIQQDEWKHPDKSYGYLHGNWIESLVAMSKHSDEIKYLILSDNNFGEGWLPGGYSSNSSPAIHIAKIPGMPMTFLRVFNPIASDRVSKLIDGWNSGPTFSPLILESESSVPDIIGPLVDLAGRCWPVL